jgi:MFS family permease
VTPPKPAAERPATFGDVFALPEYRALFAASAMSWIGDNLARAAATALVFSVTDSVILSAASFAISYLPSVTFGPLLAALAERYPHRKVMITCDIVRALLISLVAIPHLPVPAILLLLFATALLSPAFDASRSALLPRILDGDRYVVGVSVNATTSNIAMIFGYVVGGAIAPFHPHAAMLVDAATFLGSGAILTTWIQPRPVIAAAAERARLTTETIAGFRLVLRSPVLRSIAAVVFFGAMFAVVPEGLAAAWASELSHAGGDRGFDQACIMTASPVGAVIGAIVIGRLVSPATRQRLLRPLAVLVPAALVPIFLTHSVAVIAALSLISSFAAAGLVAPANGLFVQALPAEFRARAFGVMQSGLALFQGGGLLAAGYIASHVEVSTAVTIFSLIGVVVMIAISVVWPSPERVAETIATIRERNTMTLAATEGRRPRHAAPEITEPVETSDIEARAGDRVASTADVPNQTPPSRATVSSATRPEPGTPATDASRSASQPTGTQSTGTQSTMARPAGSRSAAPPAAPPSGDAPPPSAPGVRTPRSGYPSGQHHSIALPTAETPSTS